MKDTFVLWEVWDPVIFKLEPLLGPKVRKY